MDRLRDFISDHKADFEKDLLPEGHFERFKKKLPRHSKTFRMTWPMYGLIAAASVTLFIMILFQEQLPGDKRFVYPEQSCQLRKDFKDMQYYYRFQMSEVIEQMDSLNEQYSIPGSEELFQESQKIWNEYEKFESQILPTIPCSDEGLASLNTYYQLKLEGLQRMLGYMEYHIRK